MGLGRSVIIREKGISMPLTVLSPSELRLSIDPDSLGISSTSDLLGEPLPWIGQERAEQAARFGLALQQPDYNLFVLGEVGSGRSSLLKKAMQEEGARRPTPPDLCYVHNFDAPERPTALRLPAGQGRRLRQSLAQLAKALQTEIPHQLAGEPFKARSEAIQRAYKDEESRVYAELSAFAEARRFSLHREAQKMVFTMVDEKGQPVLEEQVVALPRERRAALEQAEQELRAEIARYFELMRPKERAMNEALADLQRSVVQPLLDQEIGRLLAGLAQEFPDAGKLRAYLERLAADVLDHLDAFEAPLADEEDHQAELDQVLARYRVNLLVDNDGLTGAPVLVEDNPLFRSLFGSIEYQAEEEVLMTDFTRIRSGSLLRANGGFLMLHLRDLLADPLVWEKLRRFLRSGRLQIEEPGTIYSAIAAVSLVPEAVDLDVKIVLIGSRDQFYELQEEDPEFARHFRVKVDFAESFKATPETRRASTIFVTHTCEKLGLPHFSAKAVARLLEEAHREVDDQARQSAVFAKVEALVMESAAGCRARGGSLVEDTDIESAVQAHIYRHDYPDQRLRESIAEGELMIDVHDRQIGQLNGLTQVDLGDHRFGFPVRVSARTYAGDDGVLNIDREVELTGPIHDKGMLILENFLAGLFAHVAPLSLNASIVFEQEYQGVEGDSASCAELYVLLSALSGLPLRQGISVTGAVNQHGEVLPVGGINEKIEGYFRVCETAGLDGGQGVLIPYRNRRHLMLDRRVIEAVEKGLFRIYAVEHVTEGIELLTGMPAGTPNEIGNFPHETVFGHVQKTLQAYHRACQAPEHPKGGRKLRH
jgi:predicted ATP-dependent protease